MAMKTYEGTTVSRDLPSGGRSFDQVVYQSGKPILDSELNHAQDLIARMERLLRAQGHPSGILRGQTRIDPYLDYGFTTAGDAEWSSDSFWVRRMVASVAGRPVVVEFTNNDAMSTPTEGRMPWAHGPNKVVLDPAPFSTGTAPDVKRSDFVFLEVWTAMIAPSPHARGTIQVIADSSGTPLLLDGDTVSVTDPGGASILTAKTSPNPADPAEFGLGETVNETALNLAAAIDLLGGFHANSSSDTVHLRCEAAGAAGNAAFMDFVTADGTALVLNNGTPAPTNLSGGEDRPNKPDQGHVYRHGNTLSSTAVSVEDDLMDQSVGTESAQRVQLQYRIRHTGTTEGVNHKTQPDGFSCPQVWARGAKTAPVGEYQFVPADRTTVSGSGKSNAAAYADHDAGLWIAGDGSAASAAALGTVDGFVYAIPLCFVFRRNNAYVNGEGVEGAGQGFHPGHNTNGAPPALHPGYPSNVLMGPIPASHSDRPDGGFCDVIEKKDVLDLRKHVLPAGTDVGAELRFQIQSLMDGNFFTWALDGASKQTLGNGSGDAGTRFLVCNEIGRDGGHGGHGPAGGDTKHGVLIRNFDHMARRFADQPVCERVVFEIFPGASHPNLGGSGVDGLYVEKVTGAGWYEGDIIHIDLDNLNGSTLSDWDPTYGQTYAGADGNIMKVSDLMPPGTTITDVLVSEHDDGNYTAAIDQSVQFTKVVGLGTAHLSLELDANHSQVNGGQPGATSSMVGDVAAGDAGSQRRIFVELEITYPLGSGITDTPDEVIAPTSTTVYPYGALVENDSSQRSPEMEHPTAPRFREGFREVIVEQVSNGGAPEQPIGTAVAESRVSKDRGSVRFPRRVYGSSSKQIGITDAVDSAPRTVRHFDVDGLPGSQYGSSSRLMHIETEGGPTELSGGGQTLCNITYYAQDPVPNHGQNGGGYQVSIYFRTNAPQTCGTKESDVHDASGAGPVPSELEVEILATSDEIWAGQVGMGSLELGFPYTAPLDQIPVLDSPLDPDAFPGEWYFCASAMVSVDDFDANTGLVALHPFMPADGTGTLKLGGRSLEPDEWARYPRKDNEFRVLYPFVNEDGYRPTALAQNSSGVVRHKVMYPVLGRSLQDSRLFRRGEVLLIVLSRFAELDDDNTVRFTDGENTTCAAVYRTKGCLMTVGD
jgi:hypothetical protein